MIDKLIVYYGLAIRRYSDSLENMKTAVWATYYHYSSTDTTPNHQMCPKGVDLWCSYQRTEANGEIDSYTYDYPSLPQNVLIAIKPIYEDLSADNLLSRCIGGYNQNSKTYN
ncbi:hypothetical protein ABEB36_014939 [Hypothenemus hampei]|uniref:Uncharacterized protein n=1 Tax=Hypothenemus hampei TaxID=57062 RepID=A0ABD1E1B1_HYPHA